MSHIFIYIYYSFSEKTKYKNASGTLKDKMNLHVSLGLCASLTCFNLIFFCCCCCCCCCFGFFGKKSLILKMLSNKLLSVKIHKIRKIKQTE